MYKTEDDHLNWCLFSKVQVGELCRQTEKLFSDSTKRWGNGLIYTRTEIWYFPFKVSSHKIKIRNMTKVVKSIIGLILVMFAVVVLDSCNKQENEEAEFTASEQQALGDFQAVMPTARASSKVYYSTPSVGGYTPNSSRNTPLKEICGTAEGGIIRAQVIAKMGGLFCIKITKQDGSTFKSPGMAYIKSGAVCGKSVAIRTKLKEGYNAGDSEVLVYFNATFSMGYEHFYPMVIDAKTGARYYAEPILVYTDPLYSTDFKYNNVLGTANGVSVLCNTSEDEEGKSHENRGVKGRNQCTNFCLRYIEQVYQEKITSYQGAKLWWGDTKNFKNFKRYKNSGTVPPRPGDILVLSNDKYGHVSIIMEVGDTYIKVAQQNSGPGKNNKEWLPIGGVYSRSGNFVNTTAAGYSVIGWMRYHKN